MFRLLLVGSKSITHRIINKPPIMRCSNTSLNDLQREFISMYMKHINMSITDLEIQIKDLQKQIDSICSIFYSRQSENWKLSEHHTIQLRSLDDGMIELQTMSMSNKTDIDIIYDRIKLLEADIEKLDELNKNRTNISNDFPTEIQKQINELSFEITRNNCESQRYYCMFGNELNQTRDRVKKLEEEVLI